MSCGCNQRSCVFTEGDQQSITAVKVAGQHPYILLKGKQSLSITHPHILTHTHPQTHTPIFCYLHLTEPKLIFQVFLWVHRMTRPVGRDDTCSKCQDVFYSMYIVFLIPPSPFAYLKHLQRDTVCHDGVCLRVKGGHGGFLDRSE